MSKETLPSAPPREGGHTKHCQYIQEGPDWWRWKCIVGCGCQRCRDRLDLIHRVRRGAFGPLTPAKDI